MSFAIVGNCPKCGAPVYASMIWQGMTPPPSTPSCGCMVLTAPVLTQTGTTDSTWPENPEARPATAAVPRPGLTAMMDLHRALRLVDEALDPDLSTATACMMARKALGVESIAKWREAMDEVYPDRASGS